MFDGRHSSPLLLFDAGQFHAFPSISHHDLPLSLLFFFHSQRESASAFAVALVSLFPFPLGICRCFCRALPNLTQISVISTEGGALCRRSGEIPVLAVAVAVALAFLSFPFHSVGICSCLCRCSFPPSPQMLSSRPEARFCAAVERSPYWPLLLFFFLSIPAGNLLLFLPLLLTEGAAAFRPLNRPQNKTGFSPGLSSTHPNTSRHQQTKGHGFTRAKKPSTKRRHLDRRRRTLPP